MELSISLGSVFVYGAAGSICTKSSRDAEIYLTLNLCVTVVARYLRNYLFLDKG